MLDGAWRDVRARLRGGAMLSNSTRPGPLMRVRPGTVTKRPGSFDQLVRQRELYFVFVPIRYAGRKRVAEIVAYEREIPERVRPFPLMRGAGLTDREKRPPSGSSMTASSGPGWSGSTRSSARCRSSKSLRTRRCSNDSRPAGSRRPTPRTTPRRDAPALSSGGRRRARLRGSAPRSSGGRSWATTSH
jgi:hypothetical protein